jgi:hypothetical protein
MAVVLTSFFKIFLVIGQISGETTKQEHSPFLTAAIIRSRDGRETFVPD